MSGVRVIDLAGSQLVDVVFGLREGSTRQILVDDLATMLAYDGPLNDRFIELASSFAAGYTSVATHDALLTITTDPSGTIRLVSTSDTGTHLAATATGYDGDEEPNSGEYKFQSNWDRWRRVADHPFDELAVNSTDIAALQQSLADLVTEIGTKASGDDVAAALLDLEDESDEHATDILDLEERITDVEELPQKIEERETYETEVAFLAATADGEYGYLAGAEGLYENVGGASVLVGSDELSRLRAQGQASSDALDGVSAQLKKRETYDDDVAFLAATSEGEYGYLAGAEGLYKNVNGESVWVTPEELSRLGAQGQANSDALDGVSAQLKKRETYDDYVAFLAATSEGEYGYLAGAEGLYKNVNGASVWVTPDELYRLDQSEATSTTVAEGSSGRPTLLSEVATTELVSGDALAATLGLSAGIAQESNAGWLKFFVPEEAECNRLGYDYVAYMAKRPFRYNLGWDDIDAAGAALGTSVSVGGRDFTCRLMTGGDDPAPNFGTVVADQAGANSEWNDLIMRAHYLVPSLDDPTIGMDASELTRHGGAQVGPNIAAYTSDDLFVGETYAAQGAGCWCSDTDSTSSSRRVNRGLEGVAAYTTQSNGLARTSEGWRPLLVSAATEEEIAEGNESIAADTINDAVNTLDTKIGKKLAVRDNHVSIDALLENTENGGFGYVIGDTTFYENVDGVATPVTKDELARLADAAPFSDETAFLSEVETDDLITGEALATALTLSAGIVQEETTGWLKFYVPQTAACNVLGYSYIAYVAKRPFRNSVSWDDLDAVGAVYGTSVEIGGLEYTCRLLSGAKEDPAVTYGTAVTDGAGNGSEWNDLIMRACELTPSVADESIGMEINAATRHGGPQFGANIASYTTDHLFVGVGYSGVSCWTYNTDAEVPTRRITRGAEGLAGYSSQTSTLTRSNDGWRPVLTRPASFQEVFEGISSGGSGTIVYQSPVIPSNPQPPTGDAPVMPAWRSGSYTEDAINQQLTTYQRVGRCDYVAELFDETEFGGAFGNVSEEGVIGGVLTALGYICFVPFDDTTFTTINPATLEADTDINLTGDRKWVGGVLGRNDTIYCVPFRSADILVKKSPINGVASAASREAYGLTMSDAVDKWYGGVLAPNGKIYCVPYSATECLIIDTNTDPATATLSDLGGVDLSGESKWSGGILAPNGKIYCSPRNSNDILIIDPDTDTAIRTTAGVTLSGDSKYVGWSLGADGMLYAHPRSADKLLMLDPTTDTASFPDWGLTIPSGTNACYGGVAAPDGRIYCIPRKSDKFLIIDPTTQTWSEETFGRLWDDSLMVFGNATLDTNGDIWCAPRGINRVLRLRRRGGGTYDANYTKSGFCNVF